MFAIAASASSHASDNSECQAMSAQFGQQISEIDLKCAEFGIGIAKLPFFGPKGSHSQQKGAWHGQCYFHARIDRLAQTLKKMKLLWSSL
ncbi:hypothetical protein niasHS_000256 [Heterodera schachtii]|uniref:Uncharacterized protein n=1 Tax=Heterodera schachtii TaxID=97005 RepID=A0ABD2KHL7_HETSC